MIEGFWIVQYEGMMGAGGGVVVFMKGNVFGGDTGYYYIGTYETRGDSLRAQIEVRNFLAGVPSVLGVVGDFRLSISGTVEGEVIRATGSVSSAQAVGIALKLTKRSQLPE